VQFPLNPNSDPDPDPVAAAAVQKSVVYSSSRGSSGGSAGLSQLLPDDVDAAAGA
ncbi:hypothetical protein HK405_002024, partial [Cladochytrium tenue]